MIRDLTSGPPARVLVAYALPLLLGSTFNLAAGLADRFWVSELGSESLAALGAVHALWLLLLTTFLGVGLGTLAEVARARGGGDPARAALASAQGCLAAFLLAGVLSGLTWLSAPGLRAFLPSLAAPGAHAYLGWILASALGQGAATVAVFSLQAAGANHRALWAGAVFPLANLVLDPFAIARWGLAGAGLATFVASLLSLAVGGWLLARTLGLRLADFAPEREVLRAIGAVGGPRTLDHLSRNLGGLGVVVILGVAGGTSAVAAHAAVIALLLLLIFPGVALGQATAVFVAQNLGADASERAWRGAWTAVGLYAGALLFAGVVASAFAPTWLAWLVTDPWAHAAGVRFVRILAPALPFLGAGLILGKALGSARKSGAALRNTALSHLALQLPLAFVLSRRFGVDGVFLAVALTFVLQGSLNLRLLWLLSRERAPRALPSLPVFAQGGRSS